jgi:N6-adenosine-specific RNA methylase IME4
MEIVKFNKALFEKNKLTIHDSITIDEWKQLGQSLKQVEGSVQFWIGDWARFGDKKGFTGKYVDSKVYDELEEITGLERQTIQQYKSVAGKLDTNLRSPNLSFNHHREVAKLAPEKQETFLKKASEEKLSVRDLREEIRKDDVKFTDSVEMPTGKYQVIYADPPWMYGNSMPEYFTEQANHYPLMRLEEICGMPIKDIADKNAVLFLWVTSPILEESFEVIKAWGFKYKTSFIWDKVKHNMGHYSSVRHEILLLCIRGSYPKESKNLRDSVYTEERTKHSKKPDYFYQLIDEMYPTGKKIELFARKKTEGWEVFGNEA